MRFATIVCFLGLFATSAHAQYKEPASVDGKPLPAHTVAIPTQLAVPPPVLVNSHLLYLNSCRPNGCPVTVGNADDSRTDRSAIVPHGGTLGALNASVNFDAVKQCIANAMAPFNVQVTDVDPGTADHFEIMIAGTPTQVGFDSGFLGVARSLCGGTQIQ